jgi:anaerobic magnesium-protoporphyrin IX monomethyl ester cyclase
VVVGPDAPPLARLDTLPSPFGLGLVDLSRGFVYYETSRGCPFECAFCMSADDDRVRSYSPERIRSDLGYLLAAKVPKIKLVDRTFNYDADRARDLFTFILEHNRGSHLHFEIGAHLLDEATLTLLEQVPPATFQFEIGVQSTLPATLAAIGRGAPLERLLANVRRLREKTGIELHLDLIAGLPGENYLDVLRSVDRVAALRPHHLQLEPVKLLPGSPLRREAASLGLRFDPNPPYTVLATPAMGFPELERLRGHSRLLDLTFNSGRFDGFLAALAAVCGSLTAGLERLEDDWRGRGLFRHPLSQRGVFEAVAEFVAAQFAGADQDRLRELLGRDCARAERVVPGNAPAFFATDLSAEEQERVREAVIGEAESRRGQGIKLQHFAAVFHHLPDAPGRRVLLFLYLTRAGAGLTVTERIL